jgi:recombination protein RecT
MTDTVSNAIARRDTGPSAMVAQYRKDFSDVLPSHINAATWVRLAQGALKKGKKVGGRYELEIAAANNPQAFILALRDAARLGLEPGTEEYWLTPRKVKGQTEILGIVGYQGFIELMYRAGAISSVVAECVYAKDSFEFMPGVHERPLHKIDWDEPDRGDLRLVYAYAIMKDGATSKVVVLNAQAIAVIKRSAQGADSEYSPWRTNEPAMWLKSSVRQLQKWVPTSAEYRREELRAARDVAAEGAPLPAAEQPIDVSGLSEMRDDDPDLVDAEIVDEPETTTK